MARGMEWVDEAQADAQAQVDEPILAVGFLQPAGAWGSDGTSTGSAAPAAKRGGFARSAGRAPDAAMLAVTTGAVHVFSASPAGKHAMTAGDAFASFARDDVVVELAPGKFGTRVTIVVTASGARFVLDATALGDGYNDGLLAELAAG